MSPLIGENRFATLIDEILNYRKRDGTLPGLATGTHALSILEKSPKN